MLASLFARIMAGKILQSQGNGATMTDEGRYGQVRVLRLPKPELKLATQNEAGCDPRLVELVRLLARRAARDWYEKQTKDRGRARS